MALKALVILERMGKRKLNTRNTKENRMTEIVAKKDLI
jgi:hypothetical protein